MKIDFKEEQKFTQWWLWLILVATAAIPLFIIYKQIILGEAVGNKPMSNLGLWVFSVFVFGLLFLFWLMRLKTEITPSEIRISFFPFIKKRIPWTAVKSAKVINYGFVGGWGIRLWTQYGTVYNTSGEIGLAIELLNGKKYLVGTQKESELNNIITKLPSSINK
jgi:hypothetical protein